MVQYANATCFSMERGVVVGVGLICIFIASGFHDHDNHREITLLSKVIFIIEAFLFSKACLE